MTRFAALLLIASASLLVFTGCARKSESAAAAKPAQHEHKPPHGGTPVVLGDETYHIELVRDATSGKLQAFIFDGELEDFIRSSVSSFDVVATINGAPMSLVFKPVANSITGETVGDTSLFETQADWLKTTGDFDAVLKSITIRGSTFSDVKFNFPKGNDKG
jgi:hypothetical protein